MGLTTPDKGEYCLMPGGPFDDLVERQGGVLVERTNGGSGDHVLEDRETRFGVKVLRVKDVPNVSQARDTAESSGGSTAQLQTDKSFLLLNNLSGFVAIQMVAPPPHPLLKFN